MTQYVIRRLLLMIPVAFLVTIIAFGLLRLAPGDPVLVYAGEERDPVSLQELRVLYGLDKPLPVQYIVWLQHAVRGDLGRSLRTRQPVSEAIIERLPATLELGLAAIALSTSIALIVGTIAAVKRNSFVDLLTSSITLAAVSLPNFFLGLILILVLGLALRMFPPGGYVPFLEDPGDNLRRLVLPAITLATASMAVNLRQVRSSLLDVFSHEYIRTARAKGLRESTVIARHAMKNALIPIVTLIGLQIGSVIEGAIITETIFFWPGVGRLLVDSITGLDYPVVQAVVLVSALSFMLSTLAVDMLYAWLDPRISYGRSRT
ncbi:MAG: peptide ABC transporter [Chloroflexi bacterium RIFCSPLOWO2_02_FULL_71_16]|nr:MAG: peptide ABC transporter [Chloroflexi bacterium GWC2_70_10]OGO71305.1 MAG: peptide ABC transporter [Chloroflexi bacterium RIFCSPLOWO2_02_FULL_71_16]